LKSHRLGSNSITRHRDVRKYEPASTGAALAQDSGAADTIVFQKMDGDGSGNVYLSGKYDSGGGNFNRDKCSNPSGTYLYQDRETAALRRRSGYSRLVVANDHR